MWRIFKRNVDEVVADPELSKKLGHYFSILKGERRPNYLLAKQATVEAQADGAGLDELWRAHDAFQEAFLEGSTGKEGGMAYLDLKALIANKMLEECCFCEARCGSDRAAGEKGRCMVGESSHASSWFMHLGEEAPLVPSGTIFFSGCNFKCVFCQNEDISTDPDAGMEIDARKLANIAGSLSKDGALNINYVGGDPIPNLHVIVESLRHQEHGTSQLWNSNFYNSTESLKLLVDVMDVWLPDFKYGNPDCAKRLSGVEGYWDVATRNFARVHDAAVAKDRASMIIRHLVMPGHVACCSIPIIEWIAEHLPKAVVNIMGQYRPQHLVLRHPGRYPELDGRPGRDEMHEVKKRADDLGVVWRPVS